MPSLPPGVLQCTALSSQSVRVTWEPPPLRGRNGVLQGYRVTYAPVTDWYGKWPHFPSVFFVLKFWTTSTSSVLISGSEEAVTKQISGLHTTLSGLRRYTNYSVTVCAFTAAGDGVRAAPVYCHTEEDGKKTLLNSSLNCGIRFPKLQRRFYISVPSAPADIKAVVSSRNKILVSWLPPASPNGVLVGYTLYMSVIEDGREVGPMKYAFWVSKTNTKSFLNLSITSPGRNTQKNVVSQYTVTWNSAFSATRHTSVLGVGFHAPRRRGDYACRQRTAFRLW